jgi:ribosomal protein L40E
MKLEVLVAGVLMLVTGGVLEGVGASQLFGCFSSFLSTCNSGVPTGLLVLGGVAFFVGMIVTIIGAVLGVVPQLKGLSIPLISDPIVRETVVTKEVLIQCRSCGARYPQGTLRCLTCGSNL